MDQEVITASPQVSPLGPALSAEGPGKKSGPSNRKGPLHFTALCNTDIWPYFRFQVGIEGIRQLIVHTPVKCYLATTMLLFKIKLP